MAGGLQITGVEELVKNFDLMGRDAANLARGATHKVATVVTKRAKRNAPKSSSRLRKAIKTKRRREWKGMFRSDTIVLRGDSRADPKGAFYWHFVEFGTLHQAAQPFIGPAIKETEAEAFTIYENEVVRRTIKLAEKRAA